MPPDRDPQLSSSSSPTTRRARQQQALDAAAATAPRRRRAARRPATARPIRSTDEQRRREYQSLFADNVALSRRPADRQPYGERARRTARRSRRRRDVARTRAAPAAAEQRAAARSPPQRDPRRTDRPPRCRDGADAASRGRRADDADAAEGDRRRSGRRTRFSVCSRAPSSRPCCSIGSTARSPGPSTCLVTTPVYSHDRQSVVIPAGARVLGAASPVQTWGDSRLAVSFHRLVMPDGRTYSLDRFKGLDQIGDTGLKDSVNRHYLQVFGASLAIGALSGLAQYGTRSGVDAYSFGDAYRQAAGSSLAASAGRVLDRYLNVLPTITIREGYRIKVYLTNDLDLPAYAPAASGGVR